MKTILSIFIFLLTINGFSQDERLFEQVWYLDELVIDGVSYNPPVNSEVPSVPAYFFENGELDTWICENEFIAALEYFGTNEFEFGYAEWVLGGCDINTNQDYSILYEVFWAGATTIPFVTYNIVDNNDIRTLTIDGANNNIAIYITQLLGVTNQDNISELFIIYSSGNEDQMTIVSSDKIVINGIIIYDTIGRKITESKGNFRIIDVSDLSKGIYLVKIQTNYGFAIKRVLKK